MSLSRVLTRQWVVMAAVVAATAVASGGCSPPRPDELGYLGRLVADREEKDILFAGPESVVPLDRRSWMVPLRYYEPNLDYRVPAQLNVADDQPVFEIPTSTGQRRSYRRVGKLEFTLNEEQMSLAALVEVGENNGLLFVPFRDDTSGTETYPAGRYLDLPSTRTGLYDLDFNRAYHPTCYFNEEFDCPYPPPENRLATAIRAGERLPPEDEQRFPMSSPDLVPPPASPDSP
jgi:uncharacterized protein (DUF1684 family)